jgi:hypothetical protein
MVYVMTLPVTYNIVFQSSGHDITESRKILPFDLPFHLLDVPKFSSKDKLVIHTEDNGRSIIARQSAKAPRLPQSDVCRHATPAIPCVNRRQIRPPFYVCVL